MRKLLAALAITLSASAQSVRESVTVEVVDVPVYVTRGGAPVAGLTRENFELYVNGKLQPIEYFDALAPEEQPSSLRERRLFLLLFDVAFTHPLSLGRGQRAAAHLIANAQPGDYFAVATYSSRRGVWFAVPFTQNREALVRAVASLNNSRSGDPLSIVMTPSERTSMQNWAGEAMPTALDPGNMAARIAADTLRDIGRARAVAAAEDQALDLADLSERLASLDGQKHIVMLSEGYEGRALNPFDVRVMSSPTRMDRPMSASPGPIPDHSLAARILRMHRTFQKSGVFLHALDLEGVSNSLAGSSSLNWLTSGTGGRYVHARNDFGRALTDLSASLGRGYRLGFRPADARRGYNSIKVKVVDAGNVRVNYRRGFSGTPETANPEDGVYLADVLLNDVPQSGTAPTLELRDGKLTARIPMTEVAAQLPHGGNAELLVYAFAADGTALVYHREVVPVAAGASGEKAVTLSVPDGTQVVKALLRVDGALGFVRSQ
jgi:VWFA-related protein